MKKKSLKTIYSPCLNTRKKHNILEHLYGKSVTNLKAYGIDEFDFTPSLGGFDFSVGQFGYTVFEFEDKCFYVSVDGISAKLPKRHNVNELPIDDFVRRQYIGAVLTSITFDDEKYEIKFEGMDVLRGWYEPNDGHCDRSYFELEFPWV